MTIFNSNFMNELYTGLFAIRNTEQEFVALNTHMARYFGYKFPEIIIENKIKQENFPCSAAILAEQFKLEDQYVMQSGETFKNLVFGKYGDNNNYALVLGEKRPVAKGNDIIGVALNYMDVTHYNIINFIPLLSLNNIANEQKQFSWHIKDTYSPEFSKKQSMVLFFLLKGMTMQAIANVMCVSSRTTERHIDIIKNKLGCSTKSLLIEKACSLGYMSILPQAILQQ